MLIKGLLTFIESTPLWQSTPFSWKGRIWHQERSFIERHSKRKVCGDPGIYYSHPGVGRICIYIYRKVQNTILWDWSCFCFILYQLQHGCPDILFDGSQSDRNPGCIHMWSPRKDNEIAPWPPWRGGEMPKATEPTQIRTAHRLRREGPSAPKLGPQGNRWCLYMYI